MNKIIDGLSLDFIIKDGKLKTIDGIIFDTLEKPILLETSLSAIGYIKYYNGSENISIPFYNLNDISYNALRIYNGSVTGCFNLVDVNNSLSSQIRINTSSGIKSIALGE